MRTPLHFDRVAPGGVTLPFMLAAPFFGAFAILLLLAAGGDALQSRWNSALIGALHVYTIGFLLFSITGAILQIGPVLTARPALQNERVASRLRLAIGTGAVLLGCGLFYHARVLLVPAVILLGIALPAWMVCALRGMGTTRPARALLIALAGLSIGMLLGLRLAAGHAFPEIGLPRQHTDLHAGWMLLGGMAPLVMAVGNAVIPMFQHTKPLPDWVHYLPASSVGGMLLQSIPGTGDTGIIVASAGLVVFALIVLLAHAHRRSTARDATVQLFQLAMWSAILGVVAWSLARFFPEWHQRLQWSGAVLLIVGFAGSSVHGMALKIVPFLVRLRLQRTLWESGKPAIGLPGFQRLLPQAHARVLPVLHAAAIVMLVFAGMTLNTSVLAGALVLLGVTQLALGALLWSAVIRGCRTGAEISRNVSNLEESTT